MCAKRLVGRRVTRLDLGLVTDLLEEVRTAVRAHPSRRGSSSTLSATAK